MDGIDESIDLSAVLMDFHDESTDPLSSGKIRVVGFEGALTRRGEERLVMWLLAACLAFAALLSFVPPRAHAVNASDTMPTPEENEGWTSPGMALQPGPSDDAVGEDNPVSGTLARPAAWAARIKVLGLPNFHKVSDQLYRGAQPTAKGMRELEKMGIKTVINLRSFHSDRDEMEGTGLGYVHIYAKAWHAEDEDVAAFLKAMSDESRGPFFVHCQHGADRTGTMCAVYRIVVQGWTKEEAIKEMTQGGFGYHAVWQNLIRYIQELDVDEIRRKAGLDKQDSER